MSESPQNGPVSIRNKVLIGIGLGSGLVALLAIALNAFLSQGNREENSRRFEAKQYVGAIARSEQAYFLENNQLADSFDKLGRVVKSSSIANDYSINIINGNPQSFAIIHSSPRGTFIGKLKPYVAIVRANAKTSDSEAILCEAEKVSTVMIVVVPAAAKLECPTSMIELGLK